MNMCLGIPAKIVKIEGSIADVEVGKIKKKACLDLKVPTNDGGLSLGQAVVASKKVSLEK
jgi:hydrogenase maturation factor